MDEYTDQYGVTISRYGEYTGKVDPIALWAEMDRADRAERAAWIAELRAQGVGGAHRDCWRVDRETQTLTPTHPFFWDEVEIGSLVAIGSPGKPTEIVRITGNTPGDPGYLSVASRRGSYTYEPFTTPNSVPAA